MSIKGYIEKQYRNALFARRKEDLAVKQFSYDEFPSLRMEKRDMEYENGTLSGQFYYYDGYDEGRLIVFEHGIAAGHRSYMREIEKLCSLGFRVFAYDHIGTGLSGGDHTRGLSGSVADLDFVLSELKRDGEISKLRLAVIGHSWGGFSSMAISLFHPDIEHIVAMSGFSSIKRMHKQILPLPLFAFREHLYKIERSENPLYADIDTVDVLSKTKSKVLVIHSKDDKTVKYNLHFKPIFEKLKEKENIKFLMLNGKDHHPTFTEDAVKYKASFFSQLAKRRKAGGLITDEEKIAFKDSYDFYRMTEQDNEVFSKIKEFLDS
jgi:alpha-beta hydrolase superfamily lysophospholipase